MTTVKPEDLVEGRKYRVVRECSEDPLYKQGQVVTLVNFIPDEDLNQSVLYFCADGVRGYEVVRPIDGVSPMLLEEYTPDTKPALDVAELVPERNYRITLPDRLTGMPFQLALTANNNIAKFISYVTAELVIARFLCGGRLAQIILEGSHKYPGTIIEEVDTNITSEVTGTTTITGLVTGPPLPKRKVTPYMAQKTMIFHDEFGDDGVSRVGRNEDYAEPTDKPKTYSALPNDHQRELAQSIWDRRIRPPKGGG